MTTQITGITANLTLETAAFIRDLSRSSAAVNSNTKKMAADMSRVSKSVGALGSALRGAFAAFASVATVRQIASLVRATVDSAAALKEQAQAVGIASDQMQAYQLAADQSGVSTEEFNKGVAFFVRSLGQARQGLGPMVTALKNTNKELLNQVTSAGSVSEALEIYLNTMGDTADATERARLAVAAFSRSGIKFSLLASEGVTELKQRYLDLGLVIRDDLLVKADDLQDKFAEIQAAISVGFSTGLLDSFNASLGVTDSDLTSIRDIGISLGENLGMALMEIKNTLVIMNDIARGRNIETLLQKFFDVSHVSIREGSALDFWRDVFTGQYDTAIAEFDAMLDKQVQAGKGTIIGLGVRPGTEIPATSSDHPKNVFRSPAIDPKLINESTDSILKNKLALLDWTATTQDALGRSLEFEDLQREGIQLFAELQNPLEKYASTIQRLQVLRDADAISAETWAQANRQAALTIAETALGAAGAMSGALAGLFKENKAFAIANAVINTAEAITSALKNPPGPPFSYVYAAAAAVAGAAQIATIASTSPGSSKAIKQPKGSAASSGAAKAGAASRGSGGGGSTAVNITLEGEGGFSATQVRALIGQINEAVGDGATLKVN